MSAPSPSEAPKRRFLQLGNASAASDCRKGTKDTNFPLRFSNKRLFETRNRRNWEGDSFHGRLMPEMAVSNGPTKHSCTQAEEEKIRPCCRPAKEALKQK
jgi:hypothetical protein